MRQQRDVVTGQARIPGLSLIPGRQGQPGRPSGQSPLDPRPPPRHDAPVTAATDRRLGLALLGLFLCLSGSIAWTQLMDQPWLRRSGAPAWGLMAAGLLCGLAAARADRRLLVRALAALDALLLALFAWAFFGFAALPATPAEELASAPDFTLPDHEGRPVSLSQRLGGGPILLVFYRGHW